VQCGANTRQLFPVSDLAQDRLVWQPRFNRLEGQVPAFFHHQCLRRPFGL